eukprot:TRINITY_DN6852_c0_g1_i2.p1 TRINITY_DN6852_c0_g1~~TRINITY_DN6852_c0_g1_i2.p1  ORF type:complete len:421 (-),score=81.36 TRINITY_DN6852_c0_g1_i2:114-1376(-)
MGNNHIFKGSIDINKFRDIWMAYSKTSTNSPKEVITITNAKKFITDMLFQYHVNYDQEIAERILQKISLNEDHLEYEQFSMLFFEIRGWIKSIRGITVNISRSLQNLENQIQERHSKKLKKEDIDIFFRDQNVESTYKMEHKDNPSEVLNEEEYERKVDKEEKTLILDANTVNKEVNLNIEENTSSLESKNNVIIESLKENGGLTRRRNTSDVSNLYLQHKNKEIEEGIKRLEKERGSEFLIESSDFKECLETFNKSPKKGIQLLLERKFISSIENSVDIGKLLFQNKNLLDPKQLAEFMTNKENYEILLTFVNHLNFWGLDIDMALRRLLFSFSLPGESQRIDRVVETFSKHFFSQNEQFSEFSCDSSIYTLSFSLIMLNTDLHSKNVKKKMSVNAFLRNTRGCNNGKDYPTQLLIDLY